MTETKILEVLWKVGIPRAAFQLAQLVGSTEDILRGTLRDMVRRGILSIVPRSIKFPPKLYQINIDPNYAKPTRPAPPKGVFI